MGVLRRVKRRVCYAQRKMRAYYSECAEEIAASNWHTLRNMALLYLGYLLVYLLTVCRHLALPLQTASLQIGLLAHGLFCTGVYLRGRKAPSPRAVNVAISFFAFEILGLSGYIGIAVFPSDAAFLFPLILILITQLYNRPAGYTALELSSSTVAYLAFDYHVKSPNIFVLDVIGVMVALGIALVAHYSLTNFRLHAYDAQRSLQKMCEMDSMTGVNNKTTFQYRAEQYLQSMNHAPVVAFAVCDLDDFKRVNDRYGHRMGDEVLKAFAQKLCALAEADPEVIVGRFGGDEFVILFEDGTDKEGILKKLRAFCRIDGFDFDATCSIGVAFARSDSITFDALFDCADQNAYHAKQAGNGSIYPLPEGGKSMDPGPTGRTGFRRHR